MGSGCQAEACWRCAKFSLHTRFAIRARQNPNSKQTHLTPHPSYLPCIPGRAVMMCELSGALPPVQGDKCLATVLLVSPSQKAAVDSTPSAHQLLCCAGGWSSTFTWHARTKLMLRRTDNMTHNRARSALPSIREGGKLHRDRTNLGPHSLL